MYTRLNNTRVGFIPLFVLWLFCICPAHLWASNTPGKILVGISEFPPLIYTENDQYKGFAVDIFEETIRLMEIEYELIPFQTAEKLVSAVQTATVDCGLAGLIPTSQAEGKIDFSHFLLQSGLQILVPVTQTHSFLNTIFHVIDSEIYKGLGWFILFMLIAAHVIWFIERKVNPDEFPRTYFAGVWEALWWSTVTVTTVGYGDKAPRGTLGRLFGLFWMVAGIFIFANFTATISSSLSVMHTSQLVNGPSDLSDKIVVSPKGSVAISYAEQHGWKLKQVDTLADAYSLLEKREADAVVFDAPALHYYAAGKGKNTVKVVGPLFHRDGYAMAFPLNSPLRKKVNKAILKMQENGDYDRIYQKWFGTL